MSTTTGNDTHPNNDRLKQLKEFDESKIGVKGLVDRGLTAIPTFFVHSSIPPPSNTTRLTRNRQTIPIIDLSSPHHDIVEQIRESSSSFGFFQIINHGIPLPVINRLLDSLTSFNELPESEKMKYYTRDMSHGAAFSTNLDLYQSKAASWRDTLQLRLGPMSPDWDHVPSMCKDAVIDWDKEAVGLGEKLMGLLCEGLCLENSDVLKELSCLDARIMAAHYYPYCPQPELTAGLTSHSDPGVITVLVQNKVPGLQVKVGEEWVDVEPLEGAIVINIGDILQIMSNDKYLSVEHRVLANPCREPRVSVAIFFNPNQRERLFGPLQELLSDEKSTHYRQFTFAEYMKRFFSKELDGKTLTNYYRL